jgi:hypothetical protein
MTLVVTEIKPEVKFQENSQVTANLSLTNRLLNQITNSNEMFMCLLSLYQYLLPDKLDNVLRNSKKTKIIQNDKYT